MKIFFFGCLFSALSGGRFFEGLSNRISSCVSSVNAATQSLPQRGLHYGRHHSSLTSLFAYEWFRYTPLHLTFRPGHIPIHSTEVAIRIQPTPTSLALHWNVWVLASRSHLHLPSWTHSNTFNRGCNPHPTHVYLARFALECLGPSVPLPPSSFVLGIPIHIQPSWECSNPHPTHAHLACFAQEPFFHLFPLFVSPSFPSLFHPIFFFFPDFFFVSPQLQLTRTPHAFHRRPWRSAAPVPH
jgi:hypothetical protein